MADNRTYGYARVSSVGQNEDRQIDALTKIGIQRRDIFIDKMSGKDFDRPEFQKLKSLLEEGDTLYVTSLDRLGRNYNEMYINYRDLTKEIKCNVCILDMPCLDTIRESDDLIHTVMADMFIGLLSFAAENDRKDIKERQKSGIESAKNRGVRFGRPPVEKPNNFSEIYSRVWNHEITNRQAMEIMNLKESTYYKFAREEECNIREKERSVTYDSNS